MSISKLVFLLATIYIININSAEQSPTQPLTKNPLGASLCIDTLIAKLNEDFSLPKPPAIGHTPCLSSTSSVTMGIPTPPDLMSPGSKLAAKFSPFFSPTTPEASSAKASLCASSKKTLKRKLLSSPIMPALPVLPTLALVVNPDLPLIAAPAPRSRTPIINRTAEDYLLEIACETLDQENNAGNKDLILEIGLKATAENTSDNPFKSPKSHHYGITKISHSLKKYLPNLPQ